MKGRLAMLDNGKVQIEDPSRPRCVALLVRRAGVGRVMRRGPARRLRSFDARKRCETQWLSSLACPRPQAWRNERTDLPAGRLW